MNASCPGGTCWLETLERTGPHFEQRSAPSRPPEHQEPGDPNQIGHRPKSLGLDDVWATRDQNEIGIPCCIDGAIVVPASGIDDNQVGATRARRIESLSKTTGLRRYDCDAIILAAIAPIGRGRLRVQIDDRCLVTCALCSSAGPRAIVVLPVPPFCAINETVNMFTTSTLNQ